MRWKSEFSPKERIKESPKRKERKVAVKEKVAKVKAKGIVTRKVEKDHQTLANLVQIRRPRSVSAAASRDITRETVDPREKANQKESKAKEKERT